MPLRSSTWVCFLLSLEVASGIRTDFASSGKAALHSHEVHVKNQPQLDVLEVSSAEDKLPAYFINEIEGMDCPKGSASIMDANECEGASLFVTKLRYAGTESKKNFAQGCVARSNFDITSVLFNEGGDDCIGKSCQ